MNLIFISENKKDNIIFSDNILKDKAIINGFWKNRNYDYVYNQLKNCFLIDNKPLEPEIKSSIYVLSRKFPFNPDAVIIKGNIYECASLSSLSQKEFKDIPCIAFVDNADYPLDDISISIIDKLDSIFWLETSKDQDIFFKAIYGLCKQNNIIKNLYEKIHLIKEFDIKNNNKFNDDEWNENILELIEKDIGLFFKNNPKETIYAEEI